MGLTFAEVEIVGRSYKALIDAGFNGEVLVSRRVAEEVGLKPFRIKERVTVDGRRIKVEVAVAVIKLWGRRLRFLWRYSTSFRWTCSSAYKPSSGLDM